MPLSPPDGELVEVSGETMGTNWSAHFVSPKGMAFDAADSLQPLFDDICSLMSPWRERSWIVQFNHGPAEQPVDLPPAIARVLKAGLTIAEASGGAFDPGLGIATAASGFIPGAPVMGAMPDAPWRELHGRLAKNTLSRPDGVWLDLNGIGKGYAVDRMADLFTVSGIQHFLVEIGGEFVGRGMKPDLTPWIVRVAPTAGALPLDIAVVGVAIASSGNTERFREVDGARIGHIVSDAAPVLSSVMVIAEDCMTADGWATALVAASGTAPALADARNLIAYFQWADGETRFSRAAAALL